MVVFSHTLLFLFLRLLSRCFRPGRPRANATCRVSILRLKLRQPECFGLQGRRQRLAAVDSEFIVGGHCSTGGRRPMRR